MSHPSPEYYSHTPLCVELSRGGASQEGTYVQIKAFFPACWVVASYIPPSTTVFSAFDINDDRFSLLMAFIFRWSTANLTEHEQDGVST